MTLTHLKPKKQSTITLGFAILLTAVLSLAACSQAETATDAVGGAQPETTSTQPQVEGAPEESPQQPQPAVETSIGFVDTPWVLVMYGDSANPTVVEAGTVVTALFAADGTLTGSGGCNTYNTTYQVDGNNLTVNSPIAATLMACDSGMEQETAYLSALETAQSYQITEKGILQVAYNTGAAYDEVLFYIPRRLPLEGTLWTLVSMGPEDNPQPPVAGANFTAHFEHQPETPTGLLSGTTGCNDYTSTYFAGISDLKVNLPAKSDNPDCPAGLPEQEVQYMGALNVARNYRILGDKLQIQYEGQVLNYIAGQPAAEPAPTTEPQGGPLTPLNGTTWWLVSHDTQIVIPGSEITAEFAINEDGVTGTMTGLAGCNSYSTQITGVFTVAPPTSTQSVCDTPPGIMEQEANYLAVLTGAQSITFDAAQMTITTATGTLNYSSSPPVEPELPIEPPPETPPAIISVAPSTEGVMGQEITFSGAVPEASAEIQSYNWDFNDGFSGEGQVVIHVFTAPGSFTVTLVATDVNGLAYSASVPITIVAP